MWPKEISRARLMEVAYERGITFHTALVIQRIAVGELEVTDHDAERWIKAQKNHKRFCPLCGSTRLKDYRDL